MDRDKLTTLQWFFGLLGLTFGGIGVCVRGFPLYPVKLAEQQSWANSWSFVFFAFASFAFVTMYFACGWAREARKRQLLNDYLTLGTEVAVESAKSQNRSKIMAWRRKDLARTIEEAAVAGRKVSRT